MPEPNAFNTPTVGVPVNFMQHTYIGGTLSPANFFGPQSFTACIGHERIPATRWGYESKSNLYDVCVLSHPPATSNITVYYKTNSVINDTPGYYHRCVIRHFKLKV